MELLFEILLYLLVVLGLMSITTTFFHTKSMYGDKYIRKKYKDLNVAVKVEMSGMSEEEATRIGCLIANGKFDSIYDLADEYNVFYKKVDV